MFENLTERLQAIFKTLRRHGRLSEGDVDGALREVRLALLEADVHYSVVKTFLGRVRERAVGEEVLRSLTPAQQVIKIVHEELIRMLGAPGRLNLSGNPPHAIVLVGLQGSGKTTTVAKLARYMREQGQRPWMIAADTRRPAAIEQLVVLGQQLDIPVYSQDVHVTPLEIAVNGVAAAKRDGASAVVIDTGGRLQIDDDLMAELAAIRKRLAPNEVLLVADAMTGQEAVHIAEGFNQKVGLTGLILTKVDGDARGGAAISMREVTGVPIAFLGTGEKADALEVFHPDRLAQRILGMGDVLTLIEKAQTEVDLDEEEASDLMRKVSTASFTLEDFKEQMIRLKRMGPMSQLMGMIPGVRVPDGEAMAQIDHEAARTEAIVNAMTREERRNPKILNASRRRRIAQGSGTTVQAVNQVIGRFQDAQKMMKRMARRWPSAKIGR